MKPEKQHLLDDVLGDHEGREATLVAGARILRRRRHWRTAARGLAFVLPLVLAGICLEWSNWRKLSVRTMAQTPLTASPAPVQPQALTDDELLALFPDTPVGLATLSDGRKRLIFPRPGDEQKFLTRL